MSKDKIKYRTMTTKYNRGFFGILFGRPGVGKTSLFANNDKHFLVGNELNAEFNFNGFDPTESWNNFIEQFESLKLNIDKIKEKFNLIIVDNFTDIEGMLVKDITGPRKNLSTYAGGYGAGYTELEKRIRSFLENYIIPIQKEGVNIVFICHAKESTRQDHITGVEYIMYRPSLEDKSLKPLEAHANFIFHQHVPIDLKSKSDGQTNTIIFTTSKIGSFAKKKSNIHLPDEIKIVKDKIKETWDYIHKEIESYDDN